MILSIITDSPKFLSWWLKPISSKVNTDSQEEQGLFNPLVVLGLTELGISIGGGISGNEKLKLPSLLIGAKGLALAIAGWVHIYNSNSEIKNKQAKTEQPSSMPKEQDVISVEVPSNLPKPKNLETISLEGLPQEIKAAFLLVISEEDLQNQFQYIEQLIEKSDNSEHGAKIKEKLIEIGQKLDDLDLLLGLESQSKTIRKWSLLSLLTKESEQSADKVIKAIQRKDVFVRSLLTEYSQLPIDVMKQRAKKILEIS